MPADTCNGDEHVKTGPKQPKGQIWTHSAQNAGQIQYKTTAYQTGSIDPDIECQEWGRGGRHLPEVGLAAPYDTRSDIGTAQIRV